MVVTFGVYSLFVCVRKFGCKVFAAAQKRVHLQHIARTFKQYFNRIFNFAAGIIFGFYSAAVYPRRYKTAPQRRGNIAGDVNFGAAEDKINILLNLHTENAAGKHKMYRAAVTDGKKTYYAVVAEAVMHRDIAAANAAVAKKLRKLVL